MDDPNLTERTLAALENAAEAAEAAPRVPAAVRAAWGTLHHDRDAMHPAFLAWSQHERGHTDDIPSLGEVLRRRHETPAAVAESLRTAARTLEEAHRG